MKPKLTWSILEGLDFDPGAAAGGKHTHTRVCFSGFGEFLFPRLSRRSQTFEILVLVFLLLSSCLVCSVFGLLLDI